MSRSVRFSNVTCVQKPDPGGQKLLTLKLHATSIPQRPIAGIWTEEAAR